MESFKEVVKGGGKRIKNCNHRDQYTCDCVDGTTWSPKCRSGRDCAVFDYNAKRSCGSLKAFDYFTCDDFDATHVQPGQRCPEGFKPTTVVCKDDSTHSAGRGDGPDLGRGYGR